MNYSITTATVPRWISCRTYLFGQAESRTYISNEKNHTYILLEGLASDMWKMLVDDVDETTFAVWAKEKGVTDQVDDFLRDLSDQGLLTFENKIDSYTNALYEAFPQEAKSEDEQAFINEMKGWLWDHGFMYSLFVELTYRCNLKCVHCYNPKDPSAGEINYEMCKKAIDDAYKLGCFRITFSGGESTLHSRFLDLVRYAKNKHMSVEIFTNGQILARNDALYHSLLAEYPYRIGISLYSTEKEMHERVTAVPGSFEQTNSLIHRLRKDNVNVQIKNFLLDFNCMDCIKVKKMAEKIGATSAADISLIPTIEGDKKTMRYVLSEEQLFELFTDPNSPLCIPKEYRPYDLDSIRDSSPCFGGFSGLFINPEGMVTICVSMPMDLGNIKSISLKEIWMAAMRKDPNSKLAQWQAVTIADIKECYKADYCAFCNYCPGMGYLENGYLKKSEVQCAQAKAKMRAYYSIKNGSKTQ